MRAIYSYGVAGVILVAGAAWLATGTLVAGGNGPGNGERAIIPALHADASATHEEGGIDPHLTIAERVAETAGASAPLVSVRTQTYEQQPFPIEVALRGRTQAKSVVTITPETNGVVTEVNVTKGQRVNPGDVLCTLDQGTRAAAVAQAQASLAQAQVDFDSNAELRQKGLAPANSGNALEAALKAAQSALDQAQAELDRTSVKTKAAGVVQDPLATVGTMLSPGQPCATVVQLDPMLFIGAVPEARISLAKLGLDAKVQTVTGQSADGKVSFIASTADEATRSFPVEIQIPNADGTLFSGITATATVEMGTMPAHLLPQSVLTLDDDGSLGVRAVEGDVVKFYPVTIVSDAREGVWVTGLPAKVDVITLGQEFVTAGQKVKPTNVTGTPEAAEGGASTQGV